MELSATSTAILTLIVVLDLIYIGWTLIKAKEYPYEGEH